MWFKNLSMLRLPAGFTIDTAAFEQNA